MFAEEAGPLVRLYQRAVRMASELPRKPEGWRSKANELAKICLRYDTQTAVLISSVLATDEMRFGSKTCGLDAWAMLSTCVWSWNQLPGRSATH